MKLRNLAALFLVVLGVTAHCFGQVSKKVKYVEYDDAGNVPIGTSGTGSKLAVGGVIESTTGGIKFPDGSMQTKAGITQIFTLGAITGDGTASSPLTVQTTNASPDPDAARQPFNKRFISREGIDFSTVLTTVPSGKILILEYFTGYSGTLATFLGQPSMGLTIDNVETVFLTPRVVFRNGNDSVLWNYSDPIKVRATAGQVVGVTFYTPSAQNLVVVNGYYVSVP
ncbi:MAG: hypothetical protein ACJ72Z_05715 [Pyrinomonadaceae bacterium]